MIEVVIALIGAAATLGVGFKDELRGLVSGSNHSNKALKGSWTCTWTDSTGTTTIATDTVKVEKTSGRKFRAVGTNSGYGEYPLEGKIDRATITARYSGKDNKQELVGVVILKRSVNTHRLEGYWWQIGDNDQLKGGPTVWIKS